MLAPGDRLALFSDGDSRGDQFGEQRLLEILRDNRTLDATALGQKIVSAVSDFAGGAPQDDTTLLVIAMD